MDSTRLFIVSGSFICQLLGSVLTVAANGSGIAEVQEIEFRQLG